MRFRRAAIFNADAFVFISFIYSDIEENLESISPLIYTPVTVMNELLRLGLDFKKACFI